MKSFLRTINKLGLQFIQHPFVDRIARPMCSAASILPLDLTHSDATHWISLELTSRCNLRCVYCGKSWDSHESKRAFDFPDEWIVPAMKTLHERGLIGVIASGIGETTIRNGWQEICASFVDAGLDLTIISNFARPLTPEALAALSRFTSIQVSVDTADPELFAKLRRGSRLHEVVENIDRVTEFATARQIPAPKFRFDIVVCDKTIQGMENVVRLGLEHGVTDFYFANLNKGADAPGGFNVYDVTNLPRQELSDGLAALERAIELAKRSGCTVECHPGLLDSIRDELARTEPKKELLPIIGGAKSWGAPSVADGMTRDCPDPWKYLSLGAEGEIHPCCAYEYSIGDLRTEPLENIVNGPKVRKLRQDLLSGNLNEHLCMNCSMRPQISIKEFRKRMSARLVVYSLRRRTINLISAI